MDVRAHMSMLFHLDKCIGCHTCSVACKNLWTDRKGAEYMWWNNVETRPGTGYPTRMTFRRTEHPLPPPAGKDRLIPDSFDIESSPDISSGKIFKTGEIVVIFKDVFKGSSYDVLDTIITLGRYRWDVLLLRKAGRLVFDTSLNRKFLTRKIKEQLETLFAETPPTRSKNQINPIV